MSAAVPISNNLEWLTTAARKVVERGWYLINCAPYTKIAKYSWNDLATNDESALKRWVVDEEAANPAVYLKKSNLTVLDIDAGLQDDESALRFAKLVLGVETQIVKSGKKGYHFYFTGARTLADAKYKNGAVSGDLKHNSFVLAEGAIHGETGRAYQCINPDVPISPLPKVLAGYEAEKKSKPQVKALPVESAPAPKYVYAEPTVITRKVWAGKRYEFLKDRAYYLRVRDGGSVEGITAMLKDICVRYCEDGAEYVKQENKIRDIAEYVMKYPVSPLYEPKGPPPEPTLHKLLREALPVNHFVLYDDLRRMESLVDIPTSSLYAARTALNITSYKHGGNSYWIRERAVSEQNAAFPVGTATPTTPNTYPNWNGMVDTLVVDSPAAEPPQGEVPKRKRDKEYMRARQAERRAKIKAEKSAEVSQ